MSGLLAVTRYELAALRRGQRWIPPLLLLGFVLLAGSAGGGQGPSVGDSLAFAGAVLVPVGAWLTRLVMITDPAEARACLMAPVGPIRAQLGCLLAALVATLLAAAGSVLYVAVSTAYARREVSGVFLVTVLSGLVSASACAVVGVALGAVCNPPVLRRADASVAVATVGAALALAVGGSPAYAALSDLSRTPVTSSASFAWPALALASLLLVAAGVVSVYTALRRGVR